MEYLYNRNWMENLIVTVLPKHAEAVFMEYIVTSPKTGMKILFSYLRQEDVSPALRDLIYLKYDRYIDYDSKIYIYQNKDLNFTWWLLQ